MHKRTNTEKRLLTLFIMQAYDQSETLYRFRKWTEYYFWSSICRYTDDGVPCYHVSYNVCHTKGRQFEPSLLLQINKQLKHKKHICIVHEQSIIKVTNFTFLSGLYSFKESTSLFFTHPYNYYCKKYNSLLLVRSLLYCSTCLHSI